MIDVVSEISERENSPSASGYDRFVGLEHYVSGEVEITKFGSTANLDSAMKVFHSGDILVARRNVYLKRASVVFFDGLTSGDSIVLRAKDDRMARLLPFVLNTDAFWDYADQYSDGTMSKRLSPKTLMQYEFDLPDEDQQDYLADTMWAAAKTKASYQLLLTQTNELVKSQFMEMFGDFKDNPMNWPEKPFDEFAVIDAVMTTEYEKYADYPHIGIDSIEKDTGCLYGFRTVKEDNVISGKYIFTPEHIIYSKIRPNLNKVALPNFEGLCSADAYPILPKTGICNRLFLASVLRSDFYLSYILGLSARSQMPKVNRNQIAGFKMPLPPIERQEQFADFMRQSDKSKFELKQAIESLSSLIKALMQQDFSNSEKEQI